ncbi:MAG TPA: hypothetical protein VFT84_07020 [Gemmatimonadales bacterium]|nr:hypothetical protein [Gemmatimonadales bacterium]
MQRPVVRLCTLALLGLPASAHPALAQEPDDRVNIYRFILDTDVPEPAALVAMDRAPAHVLRASAPKPLAASVGTAHDSGGATTTLVALEFSPYYLLGGGVRSLRSYRSMTAWGRIRRVITKTTLSLGAAWDPADPNAPEIGLALRATFHDPHDPIPPVGGLVERVREELDRQGLDPADDDEDVADQGVDLRPLYSASRREMRARCCLQIAGGWGLAGRLGDAAFAGDSLDQVRHTLFVTTQYTFARRFDLLSTAQVWNGFDEDTHLRVGAAIMRKTTAVDLTAELYFDSADDRLHPGAWLEGHLLPRMRAAASLTTETDAAGGPTRLRVRTLLRWYLAQAQ